MSEKTGKRQRKRFKTQIYEKREEKLDQALHLRLTIYQKLDRSVGFIQKILRFSYCFLFSFAWLNVSSFFIIIKDSREGKRGETVVAKFWERMEINRRMPILSRAIKRR